MNKTLDLTIVDLSTNKSKREIGKGCSSGGGGGDSSGGGSSSE
jgi:hypothetical protein